MPLRSSKGEISGVLGTYMDITGRKHAEEALRDAEQRFRFAVQSVSDVVFEYDVPAGTIWWGERIDELLEQRLALTHGRR